MTKQEEQCISKEEDQGLLGRSAQLQKCVRHSKNAQKNSNAWATKMSNTWAKKKRVYQADEGSFCMRCVNNSSNAKAKSNS